MKTASPSSRIHLTTDRLALNHGDFRGKQDLARYLHPPVRSPLATSSLDLAAKAFSASSPSQKLRNVAGSCPFGGDRTASQRSSAFLATRSAESSTYPRVFSRVPGPYLLRMDLVKSIEVHAHWG